LAPIRAFCASPRPSKGARKPFGAKFFSRGESRRNGAAAPAMAHTIADRRVHYHYRIATRHVEEMPIPWALLRSRCFLLWSVAGAEVFRGGIFRVIATRSARSAGRGTYTQN